MSWTDLPAVHALERQSFLETAWSLESFWAELAGVPESRAYWVAEVASDVVGYVGVMVVPPDADIQTIAVAEGHRRSGLGSRLLETASAHARSRGCRTLTLEVVSDNVAALSLYERRGFVTLSRRSGYYGTGRDALVMRRDLSSAGGQTA